jgi:putative spermidine/putrescine transport system ATP-binding protein
VTATAVRAGVEVRLEGLVRRYGTVTALDGLDLTLRPGELVALLGPSGCGKTTALRVLAGLESADAGHVVVDGLDISGLPTNKRDMGMVFQAYSLFPHLTAIQNVAFGLRLRKVPQAERLRRAAEMLELVGLSAQADRFAHQLSGGQQQRVALARALATDPDILLADEPTGALDTATGRQILELLRRTNDEGRTVLVVTHNASIARIADRVVTVVDGRIESVERNAQPVDVADVSW